MVGDPLDEGCVIAFPSCQTTPTVLLSSIQTVNLGAGAGASFSIVPHTTPVNGNFPCANVGSQCNPPGETINCASGATAFVNQGSGRPPADPTPADASTSVAMNAQLSWQTGHPGSECSLGIANHRVYFGTDSNPPLVATLSSLDNPSWDPGALQPNTTYFWRIEAIEAEFGIGSPLWSFTTQPTVTIANKGWDEIKQFYR